MVCHSYLCCRSVNRFALIRNLSFDKTGIFNAGIWDGMARE